MSYRPHKRKKATTLEGKCVERIVRDFRDIFRPGILSVALRTQVLELLCDDPILCSLPEGAPILQISLFLPAARTSTCSGYLIRVTWGGYDAFFLSMSHATLHPHDRLPR